MQQKQISELITLYTFGNPLNTGAVIANTNVACEESSEMKYFDIKTNNEGNLVLTKSLSSDEKIYGLGESMGCVNKRGNKYRCYNDDDPNHIPKKQNLYGSHPFLIFDGDDLFGIFIDYPGELKFDLGFDARNKCKIEQTRDVNNQINSNIYIIEGKNKIDIVHNLLTLIGAPFFPPKWAFGYQQSRWSYPTREAVIDICKKFRELDIPCDAIYLDLDYMDDYKVFTTSDERFPKFGEFAKLLLDDGFHLVPIIDPGVKVKEGYSVYEEGEKNNYFCKVYDYENKQQKAETFVAAVWPGRTCMPDFLNTETQKWWADLYKNFCEIGVNSFWNDMNEPALFFTKRGLDDFFKCSDEVRSRENPGLDLFELKDKANNLKNNREDYKRFCHNIDGKIYCHDDVHNIFGSSMVKASAEGLKKHSQGQRYFLLSRSSYMGQHRYSAVWTGDNHSWWEHILLHIRMIQSMNMCGFFFVGPDIPGFGYDASAELLVRWLQVGIFTPFLRNHAALFTRNQEPWAFDDEITDIARNIIKFRYAMLNYIYSEYYNSMNELKPLITPLSFSFKEPRCANIDDQYMFGQSVMVAPIYTENARGRSVLLPDCKWLAWTATDYKSRDIKLYNPGMYYFDCNLEQNLIFLKENSLFVLNEVGKNTETSIDELTVIGLVTDKATFTLYADDGKTYNYLDGKYGTLRIIVEAKKSDFHITCKYNAHKDFKNPIKTINFELYDEQGKLTKKTINM